MRQGAEDEGAPFQMCVVMSNETHLLTTEAGTLSLSLVGSREVELQRGMLRDEGAELAPGISGRPQHPDRKFMHRE